MSEENKPMSGQPQPDPQAAGQAGVPATPAATALDKPAPSAVATPRSTALSTDVKPPKAPPPPQGNPKAWSSARPIWTGAITAALLVAFFGGWGMLTTISGAVVANGVIQVEQNRQVVQSAVAASGTADWRAEYCG